MEYPEKADDYPLYNFIIMCEHFDTASQVSGAPKRPLKVFPSTSLTASLCHIIPLWDAHADTLAGTGRDAVRALYTRLTTPPRQVGAGEDGVDRFPWLDKEKLCGE